MKVEGTGARMFGLILTEDFSAPGFWVLCWRCGGRIEVSHTPGRLFYQLDCACGGRTEIVLNSHGDPLVEIRPIAEEADLEALVASGHERPEGALSLDYLREALRRARDASEEKKNGESING